MSLDITFQSRETVFCPHCKEPVSTKENLCAGSCGRDWYEILEAIGYYVPYEQRTDENNWYGKDMMLTAEQTRMVYDFVKQHPDIYYRDDIMGLLASAILDGNTVVINADW